MDKRQQAIQLLTQERDGLTAAIEQLRGLGTTRRGRPRKVDAIATRQAATPVRATTTAKTSGSAKATAKRRGRPRKADAPEKAMHA